MKEEVKKMNEIFSKISSGEESSELTPRREPPSEVTYRKYQKLTANEYIELVNGSFGECSHSLSPYFYILNKRAGHALAKWKCNYLQYYIDKNIDFT